MRKIELFRIGMYTFAVEAEVYDEPSKYGIDNGRISKLYLRRIPYPLVNIDDMTVIAFYDREWVIKPNNESDIEAYEMAKKLLLTT